MGVGGRRGSRQPVRRADNLTTFICRLSWNLGALTSWNPQGLSRPVMRLLYLFIPNGVFRNIFSPNFIWFLSPFLSRTLSFLQLPACYCLHSNKTSNSFSMFTLFVHFVIVMSVHIVFHVFAFCSIFRVEELFSFNLQVALSSEVLSLIYQITRYQIPEDVIWINNYFQNLFTC
jgi:branched-subunit amino acid transport protein AzlD